MDLRGVLIGLAVLGGIVVSIIVGIVGINSWEARRKRAHVKHA